MKKVRKGFTLIELLIVVAIIGALSAMMATSSTEAIDSSAASAILNNLQTMKVAVFEMYQQEPDVASLSTGAIDGSTSVGTGANATTVAKVLGKHLGRLDIPENYGFIGDATNGWYVYYELQDTDTAKVKAILGNAANKAGLIGVATASSANFGAATTYYSNTADPATPFIGLRVR